MARKTISQRIALEGGEAIRKQLSEFGQAGDRAFKDVQSAADKLKGPGAEFARSLDAAVKKVREVGDAIQNVGRGMRNFGAGLSVGVTAPILLAGKKALDAWKVQEEAIKRVEAAILSTGGAAGVTSADLQTMASDLQKVTTVGDEATLAMQAVLLTFTNIKGDTFGEATKATLDLSAALGTDLQSAAIQVGKALNDPVAGLSALGRSGIQFTEAQKATVRSLVETGQAAKAQEIILRELNVQFGGMAEELAKTPFGKYQQALNDLGDAWEEVGKALTPVIVKLAEGIIALAGLIKSAADAFAALPPTTQNVVLVLAGLVTVLGPVLAALGFMTMGIGALVTAFAGLGTLVAPLVAGIAGLVASAGGFAGVFSAIGTIIAGIIAPLLTLPVAFAAIGAELVLLYQNWDSIWTRMQEVLGPIGAKIAIVVAAFGTIGGAIALLVGYLGGLLPSAIAVAAVLGKIGAVVAPIVAGFASLGGAGGGLMAVMGALVPILASVGAALVSWPALIAAVVAAFGYLAVSAVIDWEGFKSGVAEAIAKFGEFQDKVEAGFKSILTDVLGFEGNWVDTFARILRYVTVDFVGGIKAAISSAINAVKSLLSSAKGGGSTSSSGDDILRGFASGGHVGGSGPTPRALRRSRPADGPIRGPGTGTSDSIVSSVRTGSFIIKAAAVRRYGPRLLEMLNGLRLSATTGTRGRSAASSSDPRTIFARLSNGEFAVRPEAVQRYGAQLFHLINQLRLPKGTITGFATGGMVSSGPALQSFGPRVSEVLTRMSMPMMPAFATGGLVSTTPSFNGPAQGPAAPYASISLTLGTERFDGITAPRETADRLVRHALSEEVKSAGRRPGWYRGI